MNKQEKRIIQLEAENKLLRELFENNWLPKMLALPDIDYAPFCTCDLSAVCQLHPLGRIFISSGV